MQAQQRERALGVAQLDREGRHPGELERLGGDDERRRVVADQQRQAEVVGARKDVHRMISGHGGEHGGPAFVDLL